MNHATGTQHHSMNHATGTQHHSMNRATNVDESSSTCLSPLLGPKLDGPSVHLQALATSEQQRKACCRRLQHQYNSAKHAAAGNISTTAQSMLQLAKSVHQRNACCSWQYQYISAKHAAAGNIRTLCNACCSWQHQYISAMHAAAGNISTSAQCMLQLAVHQRNACCSWQYQYISTTQASDLSTVHVSEPIMAHY
jgi:hypothetical protein